MGAIPIWSLALLCAGYVAAVDISNIRFPPGLNLRKIQNLMRVVDPKTCGCARPDQHCEVPVPEAKFVGFTCKVGTFCCRMKKEPSHLRIPEQVSNQWKGNIDKQQLQNAKESIKTHFSLSREEVKRYKVKDSESEVQQKLSKKPNSLPSEPVYNPNSLRETKEEKEEETIEPHHLGLPKGK